MNKNIELVKHYFEISNDSNIDEIKKLFTENSTYSSTNTGLYLWADKIIEMQEEFHWKFLSLNWDIDKIEEIKDWIIEVKFSFNWVDKKWKKISFWWAENIIVFENKIQHIEIK